MPLAKNLLGQTDIEIFRHDPLTGKNTLFDCKLWYAQEKIKM